MRVFGFEASCAESKEVAKTSRDSDFSEDFIEVETHPTIVMLRTGDGHAPLEAINAKFP